MKMARGRFLGTEIRVSVPIQGRGAGGGGAASGRKGNGVAAGDRHILLSAFPPKPCLSTE